MASHQHSSWNSYDIIKFDLKLSAKGETRLEASFWLDPALSRARMQTVQGSTVIFDGSDFYSTGPETPGARFHVLTWPYFLALPYKLDDPGTIRKDMDPTLMENSYYPTMHLSFESGVGDTPDDWYIIYQDPDTNRLHGVAYIVTYGKDKEKAEDDPHAILYKQYENFSGIPIATHWTFHYWNAPDPEQNPKNKNAENKTPVRNDANEDSTPAISKEVLMEARISNIVFYSKGTASNRNEEKLPVPFDELFQAPANARKEAKPE